MTDNAIADGLARVRAADQRLQATLAGLTDEQARQPSGLPGWTRGHVLTHLARNADGLGNLLSWARTGVVTPMYREPDGRNADIEAGSSRPAAELVADVRQAAARWLAAAGELSEQHWQNEIQRRPTSAPEPAFDLLDGRLFEVEFHHVDLELGYRFGDSPPELVHRALLVTRRRLRPDQPFLVVLDGIPGRLAFGNADQADLEGQRHPEIYGSPAAVLGWLTGRSDGAELRLIGGQRLPALPAW